MAGSELPTEPGYMPDRPRSTKQKRGPVFWATTAATAIAALIAALTQFGVIAPAAQARESTKREAPKSLDEKIDGLVTAQAEMAGDVKDIKKIQSTQTTDIAVIKRQLGLDGLGPGLNPPVRASGIGR